LVIVKKKIILTVQYVFHRKLENYSLSSQERVRVRSKIQQTPPLSSPKRGGDQSKNGIIEKHFE
jgi:hypothetical protein